LFQSQKTKLSKLLPNDATMYTELQKKVCDQPSLRVALSTSRLQSYR